MSSLVTSTTSDTLCTAALLHVQPQNLSTTEESTKVKTEKLTLKATPLPTGLVKSKTTESQGF
ncbi:MAG: hypothetical protein PUA51_06785 [Oscillospiraceae bacterium]|nr:hypothetical protein [Oscillospiraceae bacterium]